MAGVFLSIVILPLFVGWLFVRALRIARSCDAAASRGTLLAMAEQLSRVGHWRLDVRSKEVVWSAKMYRTFGLPTTFAPTLDASIAAYLTDDRAAARAITASAASRSCMPTRW